MAFELTAVVRGHLRCAAKYALIANPDAAADELTAYLLAEMGTHVDMLCRERDAGPSLKPSRQTGLAS